jgi:hypothetical protein
MLHEISDIQMVSHFATVLRYINDGKTQQRFIGYTDISADRSSNDLFSHIQNVVSEINLESKLVAEIYDGVSVMSTDLNSLQHKALEAYSHSSCALLCTCIDLVLSQSPNNIKECGTFLFLKWDCYLYLTFNQENMP